MREILFMWAAAIFGGLVGYIAGRGRRRYHDEWPEDRVLGAGSEPAVTPSVLETMSRLETFRPDYDDHERLNVGATPRYTDAPSKIWRGGGK